MFIFHFCYCCHCCAQVNGFIGKSKSTHDVLKNKEMHANATTAKPPPPINLLTAQRPPLEIHKIEGDRILIIRRIPKGRRVADMNQKHISFPSISNSTNKVKAISMQCPNTKSNQFNLRENICVYAICPLCSIHLWHLCENDNRITRNNNTIIIIIIIIALLKQPTKWTTKLMCARMCGARVCGCIKRHIRRSTFIYQWFVSPFLESYFNIWFSIILWEWKKYATHL